MGSFDAKIVIFLFFVISISLTYGKAYSKEDYPNDYYNDAEYYNDEYIYDDNKTESNEIRDADGNKETIVKRNPKFVSTPKTIMVNEGDTIKLPCTVDKLENFVIIWKKGSGILAVGDKPFDGKDARIKIESSTNGNRLVISLADFSDEGEYTCQLSALKTVELKHSVRVRVQPQIESVPKSGNIKVEAGQPVELACKVLKGSPLPEVTWRRQERPMPSGEQSITGLSVMYPKTNRHHSGIYSCSADNGWGSPATATIRLDVQHKPEIEQEETFIHSRDGDEVEITCTIHASPLADVEWYKNGQLLDLKNNVITKRGNRHSLLLQKIGETDTHGKYQCRAVNQFGEAMALTEVSGKAAPANFKSLPMGQGLTTYNLEWVVTSSSDVSEFKVEYREDSEGNSWEEVVAKVDKVEHESYAGEVTLEKLRPATRYVARVAAKNSYGYSSFSKNFDFSTYNDEIEEKKEAKKVKEFEKENQSQPKHEKSISGAESMHLSYSLGLFLSILLFLCVH
eukprot:TRINITY_DN3816_c0_g1_i1.p1 TRINITY_DN3816_c0_g1~~TRINITY_DN3816_c0_g1_i1.p1  ORF type:complete len:511 (-),score=71.37 TRINITY_DN3816_c0_g1_i1:374-1906(-)